VKRSITALAAAALLALALPGAVLAQDETFTADLSGDAEVPPAETEATGDAEVVISEDGSQVSWTISYEGLSGPPAAGHIHYGGADVAGPVMIPFPEVGESSAEGSATEADFAPVENGPQTFEEALQAIRDGEAYVNIHTEANPPGEIRAQLAAAGGEMPPTSTIESGPGVPLTIALLALGLLGFALARRRLGTIQG